MLAAKKIDWLRQLNFPKRTSDHSPNVDESFDHSQGNQRRQHSVIDYLCELIRVFCEQVRMTRIVQKEQLLNLRPKSPARVL